MHSITYASAAKDLYGEERLRDLLALSRENNAKFGITGLLLYKDGNFMQTIEGPEVCIRQLYRNICADASHDNILTILDEPIQTRAFSGWSMGYVDLNRKYRQGSYTAPEGYSDFFLSSFNMKDFMAQPSDAKELLLNFRQSMR